VLSMRWQDIDGEWWTIPAEIAKNGRSHRVPLSASGVPARGGAGSAASYASIG
jgi:hypothetical protein